jgi:hypothetical protein
MATAMVLPARAFSNPELTDEQIAEAMARAEKVACRPGDDRCYPLPYGVEDARASCTPKGCCNIGWIVANSGRDSWDVWLDLHTGEGRLRRRAD